MKSNKIIETIGSISKSEHLTSLKNYILPDTLVLRNLNPFPGYGLEGRFKGQKPVSIFLILRYRYAPEKILRITKELKQVRRLKCNASYGDIIIENNDYPCIRIKSLSRITQISEVQEFYKSHEIKFMSYHDIDHEGRIKIFKVFRLIEILDGMYRDYYESEKFYFRIPYEIGWSDMKLITESIKNKLKNKNFDTALGVIYRFSGPEEVIRVYDRNKSIERAKEITNSFLKEINSKKLHKIQS